jgi:hypothetical protein
VNVITTCDVAAIVNGIAGVVFTATPSNVRDGTVAALLP